MKRILHIVGRMDRAGAETMVMNLYRAIDREKFQFDFLYFTNDMCDYDDEIEQLGGEIFRLPSEKNDNPLRRMISVYQFLKAQKNIHTIHCHMLLSNGFHLLAGYLAGIKKRIAHSHSTSNKNSKKAIFNIPYTKLTLILIDKFATHFVACGKEAGAFLFPYQKQPFLLPNSIDVNHFNQIGQSSSSFLRDLLNLSDNCLIVSQVGRLNAIKNHQFTIELAQHMKILGKDFHFAFVGAGPLDSELKEKVKKCRLDNYISFLGLREDIPHILAGSDVMIMPSLHEGFPVVLVESQSVGVPAVISNNISPEVDLGVGLINFISLDSSLQDWCAELFGSKKQSKIEPINRISTIQKRGFDIKTTIKNVEELYQQ